MDYKSKLMDDYEDALFALLMDDVMEYEGERLWEENRRLRESDAVVISPVLDRRCRETIDEAFRKLEKITCRNRLKKGFRVFLIAALISALTFSSVYATVPEVRAATLNFIRDVSEKYGSFFFGEQEEFGDVTESHKYVLGYLPEGFEKTDGDSTASRFWETYEFGEQRIDFIVAYERESLVLNIDVEDVTYEEISILEFTGYLIKKNDENSYRTILYDETKRVILNLLFSDVDKDTAIKVLNNIKYFE